MKKLRLLLVAVLLVTLFSCTCKQKEEKQTIITLISVDELSKTDNTIQLLDVRTPEEFEAGYINNAMNINFFNDDFITQATSKLDINKPVYLYCKVGGRSGKAAKKLKEAGFTKVYDLKGGFDKWKSNLQPVTEIK
jgi:rhodanese-related sulfurtransferase|tara:strand:+ start:292 stop:699 length:408 start_codon:yes stop_codon:yes gene_type:complete